MNIEQDKKVLRNFSFFANSLTTVPGHDNDFADIDGEIWRVFIDNEEQISRNKVLGCVYISNSNMFNI